MTLVCFPVMYFPVASLFCAFQSALLYRFSSGFLIINWANFLLLNQ
jgi:hypothetical protein